MKFRRMLRDGELETREIEVQVNDAGGGMPIGMIDLPGAQGLQMQNMQEMLGKMFGGKTKPRKMTVAEARAVLLKDEADKLVDQEQLTREAVANAENNGIVFLDEIDKIAPRVENGVRGGDVSPRGRAARPAAADRGHHGHHQARAGEDRPHPVHRLRRLPPVEAVRPAAGAAGAAADPGGALGADAGGFPPHPDRAGAQPDQAVCRAAGDRGADARLHRRMRWT